jgi:hypothetical protein
MEDDDLITITNGDEPCSYCGQRPAVYHEPTGGYWCQQCVDQHHAAMLALVNDLVQAEQRRQSQKPLTPAEVERWWQRGLLSDTEALHYCVQGAQRAREELARPGTGGSWSDLAESITTEANHGHYQA